MYVVVWKYEVLAVSEMAFRVAYGPEGDWAQLFAEHDGFVGTELITIDQPRHYLTEALTVSEELVGRGSSLDSGTSGS
jgi:hypothetical protein